MDFFWGKHRHQLSRLKQLAKQPDSAQQLADACILDAQRHDFLTLELVFKHEKFYRQFTKSSHDNIQTISTLITDLPMPYALDILLHSAIAQHVLEHPDIAFYLCKIARTHHTIADALLDSSHIYSNRNPEESMRLLQKMRKALLYDKNVAGYLCDIMATHKSIAIKLFQIAYQTETSKRAYRVEYNPLQPIFNHTHKDDYLTIIKKSYRLERYIQRAHDDTPLSFGQLNQQEICNLFLHTLLASQINGTPQLGISPTISSYDPERKWPSWHPSTLRRDITSMSIG